jgi:hypothetical protein
VRHSSTLTAKREGPEPSSDTRRGDWNTPGKVAKISNMFG